MPSPEFTIVIREFVSLADYDACVALQDETWGAGFSEHVPGAILRVAQKIGGVSAGAFNRDGQLLGFVFGMTGVRDGALVHWSDMLAVRPDARGTGLADRLKQYQRDRVRALGVSVMFWTADPLVARNAQFNINHLGALPSEYVENMYGDNTGSVLHGPMPTDRFVYRWTLDAPPFRARTGDPEARDAAMASAIEFGTDARPLAVATPAHQDVRIHLPHDLSQIQAANSSHALAWRSAVRAAFTTRLGHGFTVARFVRGTSDTLPYYVLSATN